MNDEKPSPLEWALGLETPPDADVSPETQAAEAALLPLQGDAAAVPSPAVWDRIAAALDSQDANPGNRTIPITDGAWERIAAGIERKVMHVDRAAGTQAYWIRMAAGAVMPAHDHPADEHCVVLEGRIAIGGTTFGAGTYHLARKGVPHTPITACTDALFFIHGAL